MTLFGNSRAPRLNRWGGLIGTALGALLIGMSWERLAGPEQSPGADRYDWIFLSLSALIVFGSVMQFRLGLRGARFPMDPDARPQTSQPQMPTP